MHSLNLLGMMLQDAVGFDLITMWTNMGILAKGVVAILADHVGMVHRGDD